jgi:hypothetical protein
MDLSNSREYIFLLPVLQCHNNKDAATAIVLNKVIVFLRTYKLKREKPAGQKVIGHSLILKILAHSGVRKGARGEGRGARGESEFGLRWPPVHTVHIFLRRRRLTMLNPRL